MLCAVVLLVLPFAFAKTGPQCTDRDLDGVAIEGGSCGPMDCNDEDPALRPGGREICGDNIDNNCNGHADEGCRCTDTDGGKIFDVRGETCKLGAFGQRKCTVDRCVDESHLEEFFCKRISKGSFRVQSEMHTCEGVCSNGACIQQPQPTPTSCTADSDCSGSSLCLNDVCQPVTAVSSCVVPGDIDGNSAVDCADLRCAQQIVVGIGLPPPPECIAVNCMSVTPLGAPAGNNDQSDVQVIHRLAIKNGFNCQQPQPSLPVITSASPVFANPGQSVTITGTRFTLYNNAVNLMTPLWSRRIPGLTSASGQTITFTIPVDEPVGDYFIDVINQYGTTQQGYPFMVTNPPQPVPPPPMPPPILTACTDTDGGHNYATRGTATRTTPLIQGQPGFQDMTDFCVNNNTPNPRLLAEAFCTSEGFVYRENFLCPGQCVNGACVAVTGGTTIG